MYLCKTTFCIKEHGETESYEGIEAKENVSITNVFSPVKGIELLDACF